MATYQKEIEDGSVYEIETEEPEQPQQIGSKVNKLNAQIKAPQALPGGPVLPGMTVPSIPSKEEAGEEIAQEIGKTGHPYLGAAFGTAVSKGPELTVAAMDLGNIPEAAKNVIGLGKAVKAGVKAVGKRILEGPATEQTTTLRNMLSDLPLNASDKAKKLELLRVQAGKAIAQAREAAKVPQKLNVPQVSNLNEFADWMGTLKPKTDNLQTLTRLRDIAYNALQGASKTQRALIRRGMTEIDEKLVSLGGKGKAIGEAYRRYGQAEQAFEALAEETLKRKSALQKGIRNLASKAQMEKFVRKYGAAALGASGLYGMFNR